MPAEQPKQWTVAEAKDEFPWAVEIVRKRFSDGLERLCDPQFLEKRYSQFLDRDDPIYVDLLQGMKDERLSKTFVSYWTIAQTLATQSRFWLENAVAEIILHQVREKGRPATHVFSQSMLSQGYLQQQPLKMVADLGETEIEHLSERNPWRVTMKTSTLEAIDLLVGEQERAKREERKPFAPRKWDKAKDAQNRAYDEECLKRVAASFTGTGISDITLQCSLVVVEPDPLNGTVHAMAFRYVNPKTISSHPARKQERVNLFRLYAMLTQEKILREPTTILAVVAELLPRHVSEYAVDDGYPGYFSSLTYWSADRLWKFIGVPFAVVTAAIQDVAKEFRDRLKGSLRALLPDARPEDMARLERFRDENRGNMLPGLESPEEGA
ncbi:MAG: hypothetical protein NT031_13285 [Planctomycetota bacterium]|nr:hypothetical protein [Planctomycetota bacterium]